uniref:Protein kinase domain-containing protein n=1 Tax=Panagrolaimus superbus TaxID=310955 RepID=A0A914XZK6_9BILA
MAAVKSISPDSTDSKDKMPIIKGKKKEVERNMRSQAHHAQQRANIKKQQITQQLSYIPQNIRTQRGLDVDVSTSTAAHEDDEKHKKMLEHLKSLSPFNGRWEFSSVINSGSYGVVLSVSDVVTKYPGVMKVAKTGVGNDINIQAEWESFLLMKIYKANPEASVCRLLDQGLLQNYDGAPLEYMCLEYVGLRVHEHLSEYIGNDRLLRCCQISLMTLKGIYDIHKEGLIHRDLKPDNMGLISREQPIVMIYDLGMARMYTSKDGKGRPYRSTVGFRGTMEWASGNAVKGREQTRYDDLIAWFYCMIDLFHGNKDSYQVFPWSSRPKNGKID